MNFLLSITVLGRTRVLPLNDLTGDELTDVIKWVYHLKFYGIIDTFTIAWSKQNE